MSDATIAQAARRYIAARSRVSELHASLRLRGPTEAIDQWTRDQATRASHAAVDAFLDLLLAVRDEH